MCYSTISKILLFGGNPNSCQYIFDPVQVQPTYETFFKYSFLEKWNCVSSSYFFLCKGEGNNIGMISNQQERWNSETKILSFWQTKERKNESSRVERS